MCVCVCVCVCVCACACKYVHTYIHAYMHAYIVYIPNTSVRVFTVLLFLVCIRTRLSASAYNYMLSEHVLLS